MENLTAYSMQIYTKGGVRKRFVVFARNKYDALAVSVREVRNIKNVDFDTLKVIKKVSQSAEKYGKESILGKQFLKGE